MILRVWNQDDSEGGESHVRKCRERGWGKTLTPSPYFLQINSRWTEDFTVNLKPLEVFIMQQVEEFYKNPREKQEAKRKNVDIFEYIRFTTSM